MFSHAQDALNKKFIESACKANSLDIQFAPSQHQTTSEAEMFYTDFGIRTYRVTRSNYILRFAAHFDQYVNSRFVRSIGYDQVVWC